MNNIWNKEVEDWFDGNPENISIGENACKELLKIVDKNYGTDILKYFNIAAQSEDNKAWYILDYPLYLNSTCKEKFNTDENVYDEYDS